MGSIVGILSQVTAYGEDRSAILVQRHLSISSSRVHLASRTHLGCKSSFIGLSSVGPLAVSRGCDIKGTWHTSTTILLQNPEERVNFYR